MGNSAKFMLVGILVVVLLIAMIWDRSNEQAATKEVSKQYPLSGTMNDANAIHTEVLPADTGTAVGITGTAPPARGETMDPYAVAEEAARENENRAAEIPETDPAVQDEPGARMEEDTYTPVSPPPPPPEPPVVEAPRDKTYVTRQGDTFWSIAETEYGSGAKWKKIYEANRDVCPDPGLLRPGMKFRIPPLTPAAVPAVHEPVVPVEEPVNNSREYVVKPGDSLYKIAKSIYNRPMRYKEIFALNRDKLDSEDDLKVGMKLRLP